MSFKEKSVLGSLIFTVIVFGYYFTRAFGLINNTESGLADSAVLFIGVVILIIILEIILHTILAIVHRKESIQTNDERDNLIELKATRISYYILIFGILTAGISLLFVLTPLLLANIILFFFIIAEITGFSMQLYYYRKGV